MLPLEQPDRIHVAFDDHRLVANAGLLLPVTLAHHLGLGGLVVSLFRIYRPVNWEFFRIYPPDFQGHQATLGATSAIIAALWN